MKPSEIEKLRSEITTVGVYISPQIAESEVLLPAKGAWGGSKRGVVVGATLPVMVGLVSPVPGGTALGVLVAPFGALAGGVYGAATALPAEEVEHIEVELALATDRTRQKNHRKTLMELLIKLGNANTVITFAAWPGPPPDADGSISDTHSQAASRAIDTRLDITAEKAGLRGTYSIDPPTDVFLQVRAQLIRLEDDAVLLDERFDCASEEERIFREWGSDGGIQLVKEFEYCIPELAEKIIDDFFSVYPMKWNYDAPR